MLHYQFSDRFAFEMCSLETTVSPSFVFRMQVKQRVKSDALVVYRKIRQLPICCLFVLKLLIHIYPLFAELSVFLSNKRCLRDFTVCCTIKRTLHKLHINFCYYRYMFRRTLILTQIFTNFHYKIKNYKMILDMLTYSPKFSIIIF